MDKNGRAIAGDLDPAVAGFDSLPDAARIRVPAVAALFGGVNEVTVWRWERDGIIPKSQIRGRVKTWSVGEIRRALAQDSPAGVHRGPRRAMEAA